MLLKILRIFLCSIFVIFPSLFYGQENIKFSKISVENGLSQSSVTCMLQDKQGFLWIGTMSGLNRFDGYTFKTYYFDPRDTNSLGESWINSITEDDFGNLWIGTRNGGLNLFNPKNEKFTRYINDPLNPKTLSNNIVNCIYKSKDDKLWVGTENGLNVLNPETKTFERYFSDTKNKQSISNNFVNCIFNDSENTIWIGTENAGLNRYNKNENNFDKFQYKDATSDAKTVYAITEYNKSILVLATEDGLRFFDKALNSFIDVSNISDTLKHHQIRSLFKSDDTNFWCGLKLNSTNDILANFEITTGKESYYIPDKYNTDAISNEQILSIFKDKSGIIWLGTYGKGLNYFDTHLSKFKHLKRNDLLPNGLSNDYVYSIFEDQDKTVWIGTSTGGLNHYFPNSGKIEHINNEYSSNYRITAIEDAGENKLWIGCNSRNLGAFFLYDVKTKNIQNFISKPNDENYLNDNHVTSIFNDEKTVWIGTANGGLNKYNTITKKFKHYTYDSKNPNSITGNEISDISKDKEGRLWVGTKQGLNLFDEKSEKFIHFTYNSKDAQSLSNNIVLSIIQDKKGTIWVGTGMGLNKLDFETKKFKCFTIKDGLPNNYIYGVLEDNAGCLWISTNNGLSKYDPSKKTFKNFGISDGLQSKEFNTHAFHKGKSGYLFFGGINGINLFYPDSVKESKIIPATLITSFKVFGKEVLFDTAISHKKNIKINYSQNFLSFEFTSVDYLHPDKNEFSCKMEGFDKDWIYLGNTHNVSYSNLDPGAYTLRVKSTNNDGVWNDIGTSIHITILPPFYKTKWFYASCILIIIITAFFFHKRRIKTFLKTQQILEFQVKERTTEIENQKDEIEAKNKDITDSINYAKRIQNALLTSDTYLSKYLPSHFVLHKPKDIISGDFYWAAHTDTGKVYVVTADCTGHGVPGAFMSLIGASKLNEIILEKKIYNPANILNQLREDIINSLNPEGSKLESHDGMDMVICCYDFKNMTLDFACANNPLWIIRGNELIEFKADKMPVGKHYGEKNSYTLQSVILQKNDIIYSFTDGYADQFGGPIGKKFKYKQLQNVLLTNREKPLNKQKEIMNVLIENWKGSLEQVDDILIVGVKV